MKKVFVIILLSLFSTAVWASEWGIIGGLNYSKGDVDLSGQKDSMSSIMGFQIGARAYHDLGDFQIRYGLEVKKMGLDKNYYSAPLDLTLEYEVNNLYLTAPVTVLFAVNEKFSLFGGVGINILVSEDFGMKADGVGLSDNDIGADFESFFLTLEIGGAIKLTEKTLLEAYYNMGVTPALDDSIIVGEAKLDINNFGVNFIYLL